jgi:hypothetical protein
MVSASELRVGNWVEHNGRKRCIQEIGQYGIDLYVDNDQKVYASISFDELEGIGLSPEILIDFGFEEMIGDIHEVVSPELQHTVASMAQQGYNYRKKVATSEDTYILECVFTGGWRFQNVKLIMDPMYVHELQNLYYYLMKEELQFPKYE